MKSFKTALLVCFLFTAFGCLSGPEFISEGVSAEEIIQMAQSAMDRDRYDAAIGYYEAILDRFPANQEAVCDAEYGISLIRYKQKRYDLAYDGFTAILAKFKTQSGARLPQKYRVLSQIGLEKIDRDANKNPPSLFP